MHFPPIFVNVSCSHTFRTSSVDEMGQEGSVPGSPLMPVENTTSPKLEGFQISSVLPGSPAMSAGLIPYFDIVTAMDNIHFEDKSTPKEEKILFFQNYVASRVNSPVLLEVYNIKIRATREVSCTPNKCWGGNSLLGCSILWTDTKTAQLNCAHIVAVADGSPAACCGKLKGMRDYIVGYRLSEDQSTCMIDYRESFLPTLLEEATQGSADRSGAVQLLIYNSENNVLQEFKVPIVSGKLGIAVADGMLHLIPLQRSRTNSVLPVYISEDGQKETPTVTTPEPIPSPPSDSTSDTLQQEHTAEELHPLMERSPPPLHREVIAPDEPHAEGEAASLSESQTASNGRSAISLPKDSTEAGRTPSLQEELTRKEAPHYHSEEVAWYEMVTEHLIASAPPTPKKLLKFPPHLSIPPPLQYPLMQWRI